MRADTRRGRPVSDWLILIIVIVCVIVSAVCISRRSF